LTDDLTDLPGRVQAELTRLRAERQVFTAEQDRLKARLADTEQELQDHLAIAAKQTGDGARIAELERAHQVLSARARALESDLATVRRERDSLRAELAACREERDRVRLRLLDAELALSAGIDSVDTADPPVADQRAIMAEYRAGELARELAATHQTLSWRVTRPLRAMRRKIPRS
jgi:chromosome segregation ATPase